MKPGKLLIMAALLAVSGTSFARGPAIEAGTAVCDARGERARKCGIRWDLSATPRAFYGVQWLDPASGQWQSAFARRFQSPYASAGNVVSGRLYRILGCDDDGLTRNCVSTTAFWAPVMPRSGDIPEIVPVSTEDGRVEHARISEDAHRYTRLMQLNVYLLSDLLGRTSSAALPPMTAPLEPGAPGDIAHDVHHNVYAAYEAARTYRQQQQQR